MSVKCRAAPSGSASSGLHTVQNFGPDTTAIVYGLQNRAVQVCSNSNSYLANTAVVKYVFLVVFPCARVVTVRNMLRPTTSCSWNGVARRDPSYWCCRGVAPQAQEPYLHLTSPKTPRRGQVWCSTEHCGNADNWSVWCLLQGMLDFDFMCKREKPSVACMVFPFSGNHYIKFYWGTVSCLCPLVKYTTCIVHCSFAD